MKTNPSSSGPGLEHLRSYGQAVNEREARAACLSSSSPRYSAAARGRISDTLQHLRQHKQPSSDARRSSSRVARARSLHTAGGGALSPPFLPLHLYNDVRMASSASPDEPALDKPLPTKPAPLPLPPLEQLLALQSAELPGSIPLDERSWQHLELLAGQALKGCKISEEVWMVSWLSRGACGGDDARGRGEVRRLSDQQGNCMYACGDLARALPWGRSLALSAAGARLRRACAGRHSLATGVGADRISRHQEPILSSLRALAASLTPTFLSAIAESRLALQAATDAAASRAGQGKEKEKDSKERGTPTSVEDEQLLVKQRERWEAAMLLLEDEEGEPPQGHAGHVVEPSEASTWSHIADPVKLRFGRWLLSTTETTLGAVKAGVAVLGVRYEADQWEGQRLFGADSLPGAFHLTRCKLLKVTSVFRSRADLGEEDLKRYITLVGGTFHLTTTPKDRPRLERILEVLAFATLSLKLEVHLLRDVQCPWPPVEEPEVVGPTTPIEVTPPPPPLDSASLPSEQWRTRPKLSKHVKHKGINLWSLLSGSHRSPSPASSPPNSPLVTAPPPHTTRRDSVAAVSGTESACSSSLSVSSSISSDTPQPTPRRVKDKFRSFGEGLLRRKRKNSTADTTTESLGPQSASDSSIDGGGWDFLGKGIFSPAAGESHLIGGPQRRDAIEEEVAEEPADRFERVIKKMEQCILSVSPDVVFPPPHLLVRLRQQEGRVDSRPSLPPKSETHSPPHLRHILRPIACRRTPLWTLKPSPLASRRAKLIRRKLGAPQHILTRLQQPLASRSTSRLDWQAFSPTTTASAV